MEKLIELLNEYEIKRKKTKMDITDKRTEGDFDNEYTQLIIISKQFGFIKWLVENNKIDFSREGDLSNELVDLFERKLDNAEGVIALLSISDTPIDDLINYLK